MIKATSKIKMNMGKVKQLTNGAATALEKTAEALHTDIVQAQVMPRNTGAMQNEDTFVDYSESRQGKVILSTSSPYARRMYFHPEYHFQTDENPNAKGKWLDDWLPGGKKQDFAPNAFKKFYRKECGL